MRIVGGRWRGRAIKAPKGDLTRPTTDRVKEAIFSAISSRLGADLGGGAVLDAFAGSGSLGLEALSRGASSATFAERDRKALATLRENIATLGAHECSLVVTGDIFSLAKRGVGGGPFSLIMLDPPYTLDPAEVARLLEDLLGAGSVSLDALVTWELPVSAEPQWPEGLHEVARKRYGGTHVVFAENEGGPAR